MRIVAAAAALGVDEASALLQRMEFALEPSTYSILTQGGKVVDTLRGTSTPGLSILPAHLDHFRFHVLFYQLARGTLRQVATP